MMKRNIRFLILSVLAICLFVVCAECSSEGAGVPEEQVYEVPEEQVYEEISYYYEALAEYADSCEYTVSHNANNKTHMDTVSVKITAKSKYGTATKEMVLEYQYQKANDIWELDSKGDWEGSFSPNKKAFIGVWTLYTDTTMYELTILDVDEAGATVTLIDRGEPLMIGDYIKYKYNGPSDFARGGVGIALDSSPRIFLDISGVRDFYRYFTKGH